MLDQLWAPQDKRYKLTNPGEYLYQWVMDDIHPHHLRYLTMALRDPLPSEIIYTTWDIIYSCWGVAVKNQNSSSALNSLFFQEGQLLAYLCCCYISWIEQHKWPKNYNYSRLTECTSKNMGMDFIRMVNVLTSPVSMCQHLSKLSTPCCGCSPHYATCLPADSVPRAAPWHPAAAEHRAPAA